MKLSKAIKMLDDLKEKHGDIDLCLADADTGWVFVIKDKNFDYYESGGVGRIEIGVDYNDELVDT